MRYYKTETNQIINIYEYNIEIGYNINYYRPAFFLDRENLLAKSVVLSEYFGK